MKRLARMLIAPCLVARRSYLAMRAVRYLYRFKPLVGAINFLFDPNSIRKHTAHSIPAMYVNVRGRLGEQLRVNLGDHIGWNIFLTGHFDLTPVIAGLVLQQECPQGVYIDIGANIGDTSIAIARHGIHTVGIDASAMAISELCHNIAINSPIPYTVVHAAVSATPKPRCGEVEHDYIKLHVPMGNTGAASVHDDWNPSRSQSASLLAAPRTISEIVESLSIDSVSCIKLDVEGAEREALAGMRSLLDATKAPLIFEYRRDLSSGNETAEAMLELLPKQYRCYGIRCIDIVEDRATLRIEPFDRDRSYENVLAVAESLPPSLAPAEHPSGLVVPFARDAA